jgi:hypothetical protein
MKSRLLGPAYIAILAVVSAIPMMAPADPLSRSVAAPVMKKSITLQSAEACVYDHAYFDGSSNNGTTFCSTKLGYQDLPPARQGRISAANVPQGYVLILYAGPGQAGATCRLVGPNAGLDASCNDMARGMSLERNVGAARTAQQEDARRQAQETTARATADGAAWAAPILAKQEENRQREAAAARAKQAEEDQEKWRLAYAAREDQARRSQEYREAKEAERAEAEWANSSFGKALLNRSNANFGTTDGLFPKVLHVVGKGENYAYIGDQWNDDIEVINIDRPEIKIIAYEHSNYTGRQIELTCGEWELIGDPENEISSFKVEFNRFGWVTQCPTPGRNAIRNWMR